MNPKGYDANIHTHLTFQDDSVVRSIIWCGTDLRDKWNVIVLANYSDDLLDLPDVRELTPYDETGMKLVSVPVERVHAFFDADEAAAVEALFDADERLLSYAR